VQIQMRFLSLLALLVFAGCSGNGSSGGSSTPCPALSFSAILISPTPGSVNVPSTLGTIEVGNVTAGQQIQVSLKTSSGATLLTTSTAASAADGRGSTLAVPNLAAQTTYAVSLYDIGACHFLTSAPIGSFTTQ